MPDNPRQSSIVKQLMRRAGVSLRFLEATMGNVDHAARASVSKWKLGNSLYLYGRVGCGKTYFCSALVRAYVESQYLAYEELEPWEKEAWRGDTLLINITDLFQALRNTYQNKTDSAEVIDNYCNVKKLLIDDVGAEKVTDWTIDTLYTIIDYRNRNLKQTLITSNLDPEALVMRVGDRIASRIMEMCDVVELEGGDRRLK